MNPPPPFLNSWSFRKTHAITGSSSGDLTNYPMKFIVHRTGGTDSGADVYLGTNVKADYSDLRFTDLSNNLLSYWVQDSNLQQATVWVKMPAIPTTGTQIYLYYGNGNAASASNADATFIAAEDGESSDISDWSAVSGVTLSVTNSGTYTGSGAITSVHDGSAAWKSAWKSTQAFSSGILEFSGKPSQTTAYHGVYISSVAYVVFGPNGYIQYYNNGWQNAVPYSANTYYKFKLVFKSSQAYDLYINDALVASNIPVLGASSSYSNIFIAAFGGGSTVWDNVFLRPYISIEPSQGVWSDIENSAA